MGTGGNAWDVDYHKAAGEDDVRWQRRRSFMTTHHGQMAELELVFLSQLFTNIEFMCCKYPDEAMHQLGLLPPKTMADEFRKTLSKKLKRKFDIGMAANIGGSAVSEKGDAVGKSAKKKAVVQKPQEPKKKATVKARAMVKLVKKKSKISKTTAVLQNWLKMQGKSKQQMKKAELDEQPVDLRSILSQHSPSTQQMKALPNHAGPVFDLPSNPIITFVAPTPVRIHSPITFDTADVEDSKSTNSGEGGKVDKLTPCKSKRSKLSVSFNHCNKKPYDKRHQSPAAPPILMEPAGQPQPSTSSAVASYHPSSYYYMSSTSTFDQRMMDHRNEPNTYPMIEYPQSNYQQYQADDYQDYEEYPAPYEDYQPNDSVEYSTDFHDEAQRHQSDTGNQYGNVIILDWCDPQKLRRSVEILSATALHHHLLMKFVYRKCERFHYCTAELVGIMSSTSGQPATSKEQSRIMACTQLLDQMQQYCYTIQSKPDSPPRQTLHIDRAFIEVNRHAYVKSAIASGACNPNDKRLTADNKGFQMMKQLGWSGGALGTSGTGIKEPIQVQSRANRRGLGLPAEPPSPRVPVNHFDFFDAFLQSYARKTHSVYPIAVHMDYGQKEWRMLAEIVTKCGLKLEYTSSGTKRQTMHIEKIISPEEMAENIRQGGVYSDFYNLFPPNNGGN